MKCKRCGHRTNTLPAMGAHVRKKHPGAMKRKHHTESTPKRSKSRRTSSPPDVSTSESGGTITITIRR